MATRSTLTLKLTSRIFNLCGHQWRMLLFIVGEKKFAEKGLKSDVSAYCTLIGMRTLNEESIATPAFIAGKKRHC